MTPDQPQRTDRLRKRLIELDLWTVRAAGPARRLDLRRRPARPRRRLAAPRRHRHPRPRRRRGARRLAAGGDPPRRRPRRRGPAPHRLRRRRRRGLRPRPQPPALPAHAPAASRSAPTCVARLPFGVPNRDARLARARLIRLDPDLAELTLLLTQVAETADELAGHEVVPPLLAAAEATLAELDWPTATAAYVARVAPSRRIPAHLAAPADLDTAPAGLDDRQRDRVGVAAPRARRPPARPARPLPADRRAGADRPRPYRPRLALAARRDPAQGQPHLLDHDRPDGPQPRVPLQPVDRPALRLPRGGRPRALRADQGEGRRRPVGAERRDVGRARHQHADRRVLRPPAPLRPALLREDVRQAPHRLLAARLLRLLAGAAAAPEPRRRHQLLHHQGELVRDQRDALRPLLVGGPRRQPRPRPHLQQPGRRLQRRDRPARHRSRPGRTSAASTPTPRACSPSATATAAAARPRRCSTASASSPTSPWCPTLRPTKVEDWFAETRTPRRRRPDPAGLGRRDVSRAPPRHPHHPGPHQVPAPPRRARADHRRDRSPRMATLLGDARARLARAALARAPAQRVPRHPARLQHPRGLRGSRARARRRHRRRRRGHRRPPRRHRRPPRPRRRHARRSSSSTPTSRPARSASPRPTRSPAARRSKAAASSPARRRSPASPPP